MVENMVKHSLLLSFEVNLMQTSKMLLTLDILYYVNNCIE